MLFKQHYFHRTTEKNRSMYSARLLLLHIVDIAIIVHRGHGRVIHITTTHKDRKCYKINVPIQHPRTVQLYWANMASLSQHLLWFSDSSNKCGELNNVSLCGSIFFGHLHAGSWCCA